MNEPIKYQTLKHAGKPTHVIVDHAQFMELLEQAKISETVPHEVVSAMVDGISPVKAWREHKKLTQKEVADAMGITQPSYRAMEQSDAKLRKGSIEKLAAALGTTFEQLDL